MSRSHRASVPEDHIIVLFGALGDLARRKLLPGLFHLDRAGLMPAGYKIVGTSRKGGSDDDFRRVARDAIGEAAGDMWERFAQGLSFSAFRAGEPEPLQEAVARAEGELGGEPRRLHYLSIPPGAFGDIVVALGSSGLADRARVVLEKPFCARSTPRVPSKRSSIVSPDFSWPSPRRRTTRCSTHWRRSS